MPALILVPHHNLTPSLPTGLRSWSYYQPIGGSAEDLHEPATHLDNAGNDIPDQSVQPDDLPEMDMERPIQVSFSKEHRCALALMQLIRRPRYGDGTLQPVPLPKVGPNTPYPSNLKGTHCRVHGH